LVNLLPLNGLASMLTVVGVVVVAEQSQFGQIKIKISALQHKQRVLRLPLRRKPRNLHSLNNLNHQNKKVYGMC